MNYRSILGKTAALGVIVTTPAVIAVWYFAGRAAAFGVIAGSSIALVNLAASLFTVMTVSGERPATSILLVMFSFPVRLAAVGAAFFLISRSGLINISTTAVSLVVVYTMFAWSEFRFASLRNDSLSKLKTL